jgi:hypothetical protein
MVEWMDSKQIGDEYSTSRETLLAGAYAADMMVTAMTIANDRSDKDQEAAYESFNDIVNTVTRIPAINEAVLLVFAACLGRAESTLRGADRLRNHVKAEAPEVFAEIESWLNRL